MRFLEFVHYSVSPFVKFLICVVVLLALLVVYRWQPESREREWFDSENEDGDVSGVKPTEWNPERVLRPKETKRESLEHPVLEEMDEYLQALRREKIRSLDEV